MQSIAVHNWMVLSGGNAGIVYIIDSKGLIKLQAQFHSEINQWIRMIIMINTKLFTLFYQNKSEKTCQFIPKVFSGVGA